MSQSILFEKEGHIAWIKFNDPEKLNALSDEMGMTLVKLIPKINKDPEIRVVILTGEGRAFSAGGNLDIIVARTKKTKVTNQKEMIQFYNRFLSITKIEVPVIAMINGPAIGAACCLALACDLRVASTAAKIGVNFVKIGLSPGMGSTFFLPQVLGVPSAMELLLTGRTIAAEEARSMHLIHHLFSVESLKEETLKIAREIAANAPLAVKIAKKGILSHLSLLQKSLAYESKGQSVTFHSKDILEGIEAIRRKVPPSFIGK